MSKQVSIILIIATAILTSQCTTNKNKMIEKINELESEVNASFPNPNPLKIKELKYIYVRFSIGLFLSLMYSYHARLSDAAKFNILPTSSINLFSKYLCFTIYHIM
jgi:hypothetical protein